MTRSKTHTFGGGNGEAVLPIVPIKPPLSDLLQTLAALPRPTDVEVRDQENLPEREGL